MFRRLAASPASVSVAARLKSTAVRSVTRTRPWTSFGVYMAEQKGAKHLEGLRGTARGKALGALYRKLGKEEVTRLKHVAAKRKPHTFQVTVPLSTKRQPTAYNLFVQKAFASGKLVGKTSKERLAEVATLWKAQQ